MKNTKIKIEILPLLVYVLLSVVVARVNTEPMSKPEPIESENPVVFISATEMPIPETVFVDIQDDDPPTDTRDWTEEADILAKMVYGEAGCCDKDGQAAVIWCALNRVDSDNPFFPDDIFGVVTQYQQFHGYDPDNQVFPELRELALDVIERWQREKSGDQDIGRVLPAEYLFFHGDGKENYFRKDYQDFSEIWDWSLESPYKEGFR